MSEDRTDDNVIQIHMGLC